MPSSPRRVVTALLLCLAMLLCTACDKTKVTEENYAKLKVGMSLKEVENILGSKGNDETSAPGFGVGNSGLTGGGSTPDNVYVWKSKDLKIVVTCKDGKVVQLSKMAI